MYIYELPFDINKELCRLLDIDDYWKELAGDQMKYSPFDINEIEQAARRYSNSPTHQLFTKWGQLNHRVEELFILLYHMKYVPALRCLTPLVDARFHRLLNKLDSKNIVKKKEVSNDENGNLKTTHKADGSQYSIPLPVMLIGQDGQSNPTKPSINGHNGNTPMSESSNGMSSSRNSTSTRNGKPKDLADEIIKNVASIPMMSYEDLQAATDNWSDANLLGRGGFGQVFKGEWKCSSVAVKRLRDDEGRNKELIREMCLNQYRHDNILPLYGYSYGGPEACLVYQLMMGGSLEQRLRIKTHHPPLTWPQRYKIAHGVARGLQYLHNMCGTPLIHGDIKPANILLDPCLMPKIGDFGLARKGAPEDRTHLKVSKVYGTRPYLPDEYLRSNFLSPAVDVFSFGVVLLEMASALPPLDRARASPMLSAHVCTLTRTQNDFATLEDPVLRGTPESNPQLCSEFIELGLHCTRDRWSDRPSMLGVYKRLDAMELPGKQIF